MKRRFRIRLEHKGKTYSASVRRDGTISRGGEIFSSPSGAAKAITKRATAGWDIWQYERAPGDWVQLKEIRR